MRVNVFDLLFWNFNNFGRLIGRKDSMVLSATTGSGIHYGLLPALAFMFLEKFRVFSFLEDQVWILVAIVFFSMGPPVLIYLVFGRGKKVISEMERRGAEATYGLNFFLSLYTMAQVVIFVTGVFILRNLKVSGA